MKLFFSLFITVLFFIGCGEETKDEKPESKESLFEVDSSNIETSSVENPNQDFLMRYKLELNKNYRYRIASISVNKQSMQTDTLISQVVNQNLIYIINVKPLEIDSDSIYEIACTFSSIKLDASGNNQTFSYESGVTKDSLELIRYANNESLINNTFNLRVNSKGEIIEIYKIDKIVSKYLELQNLQDSVKAEDKNLLRDQISQGAIKPLLTQIFRKLPENEVAKDSSWTISQPPFSFLVFKLQNNYNYKITSLEEYKGEKVAVLDAGLKSNVTGNNKTTEQGITYDFKKPVSEASGTIYFNIENGYVLKANTKTKTTISVTIEGNTPTGKQKGTRTEVNEFNNIVELL